MHLHIAIKKICPCDQARWLARAAWVCRSNPEARLNVHQHSSFFPDTFCRDMGCPVVNVPVVVFHRAQHFLRNKGLQGLPLLIALHAGEGEKSHPAGSFNSLLPSKEQWGVTRRTPQARRVRKADRPKNPLMACHPRPEWPLPESSPREPESSLPLESPPEPLWPPRSSPGSGSLPLASDSLA